ncbi:MAG TPA: polysaccharide deacetylase family protein [Actinomycetota bacterium]
MELLRKGIKTAVLPAGVLRPRRDGDLVVLLYHRVGVGSSEIDLPLELFERQMRTLAEEDRPTGLDEAVSDGSRGGVVVTFDDGTPDFHSHVVPVLVRCRIPAVLYLATGPVEGGNGSLSWAQLEEAVATGLVTVGSHTHSHRALVRVSEREAEDEMRRSKELIEDRLGVECRHFAYPFAAGSPAADRAARRVFRTAALHAWRTNRKGHTDPHALGRTPVLRSDGRRFFRAKVRGMLDGEALIYRALRRGPWRWS